jgi:hypothetical protein
MSLQRNVCEREGWPSPGKRKESNAFGGGKAALNMGGDNDKK